MDLAEKRYKMTPGEVDEDGGKAQAFKDYAAAAQAYQSTRRSTTTGTRGPPTRSSRRNWMPSWPRRRPMSGAQAQRTLEGVNDGPNKTELAKAELQVQNAEANVANPSAT